MSAPGYRWLFATYPFAWRVRWEQEVLALLRDADALQGRSSASIPDRLRLLRDGLARRRDSSSGPVMRRLTPGEHRFDQSNGLNPEREQTAFELEHARWWDHEDTPGFLPFAMTGGRPQMRT